MIGLNLGLKIAPPLILLLRLFFCTRLVLSSTAYQTTTTTTTKSPFLDFFSLFSRSGNVRSRVYILFYIFGSGQKLNNKVLKVCSKRFSIHLKDLFKWGKMALLLFAYLWYWLRVEHRIPAVTATSTTLDWKRMYTIQLFLWGGGCSSAN